MHLPTPPTMLLLLLLSVSTTASSLNIKPNSLPLPLPHQPQAIILTHGHQQPHHLHQQHQPQHEQHDQQYQQYHLQEQKVMNISTSAPTGSSTRRRKTVAVQEEDTITARKIVGGIAVAVLVAVI